MHIAFLGLGPMGQAVARRLAENKFSITVWNRTLIACEPLRTFGVTVSPSSEDAVRDADLVFTMLRDDDALHSVLFGAGVMRAMREGSVHISLSTISTAMANLLEAEHRKRHQGYVSAPVFGGPPSASDGTLWTIAAGRKETLERLSPVFEAYSRGVTLLDDLPARANAIKLAGNAVTLAMTGGLSEATAIMEASNVSAKLFHEVMDNAVFQSPIFRRFSEAMLKPKEEPGPLVWQALQVLRYLRNLSRECDFGTPILETLNDNLESISNMGMGDEGFAGEYLSLARRERECE